MATRQLEKKGESPTQTFVPRMLCFQVSCLEILLHLTPFPTGWLLFETAIHFASSLRPLGLRRLLSYSASRSREYRLSTIQSIFVVLVFLFGRESPTDASEEQP